MSSLNKPVNIRIKYRLIFGLHLYPRPMVFDEGLWFVNSRRFSYPCDSYPCLPGDWMWHYKCYYPNSFILLKSIRDTRKELFHLLLFSDCHGVTREDYMVRVETRLYYKLNLECSWNIQYKTTIRIKSPLLRLLISLGHSTSSCVMIIILPV